MTDNRTKNIYLIGFMGSGKSTVGPLLAKRLNWGFFDTDVWIENETGKSISQIFEQFGEYYFREKEKQAIQIASELRNFVISVGGGAVIESQNWLRLKESGVLVYLKSDVDLLFQRLENACDRPLLINNTDRKAAIEKLLKARAPIYENADITVEIENFTPEEISLKIAKIIKERL